VPVLSAITATTLYKSISIVSHNQKTLKAKHAPRTTQQLTQDCNHASHNTRHDAPRLRGLCI